MAAMYQRHSGIPLRAAHRSDEFIVLDAVRPESYRENQLEGDL
jgi:hypothetical protein